MSSIGAKVFYDYRDDPSLDDPNRTYGVPRYSAVFLSDENFNPIWDKYRPPNKPLSEQLSTFYRTPMEDPKAEKPDGMFKQGIPYAVLAPLAEFWLQHPILKPLRKAYENCKVMKQSPAHCIEEGASYVKKMNQVAEQPFTKCPKQTVSFVKCVDDNGLNFFMCRDLQVEWESCMKTHFDVSFPPFPKDPRYPEWNAGQEAPYRMRWKRAQRDAEADMHRHMGLGTIHPETDLFSDYF